MPKQSKARKVSETPTRVYSYGIPFISKDAEKIIFDQLILANRYRNNLVHIELVRRNKYRELRKSLSDKMNSLENEYSSITKEIDDAYTELRKLHKADRNESPLQETIKQLKAKAKAVWDKVKKERDIVSDEFFHPADAEFAKRKKERIASLDKGDGKKVGPRTIAKINQELRDEMLAEGWPDAWKKKADIEHEAHEAALKARETSGCYVGVYLAVDEAAKRSFSDSMTDPRFRRFDGEGKVGAQITGGLTAPVAISCRDAKLKIELNDTKIRGGKQAAVVRLRLSAKPTPVFIDVPIVLHRPMPEDAVIKWAYIVSRRVGTKTRYEIQFTIESAAFVEQPRNVSGAIAINLGWRIMKDRIVIGTTWDGTKSEEISVSNDLRETHKYIKGLLSVADGLFEGVRNEFRELLKTDLKEWSEKEENSKMQLGSVHLWRDHGKLARASKALLKYAFFAFDEDGLKKKLGQLWMSWKAERFANGVKRDLFSSIDEVFAWLERAGIEDRIKKIAIYLEWWRRKDEHLVNWARNMERTMKLNIREIYRVKASELSKRYEYVIVEKWNKSKTAEIPDPAESNRSDQEENAAKVRQLVGVSNLALALKASFGSKFIEASAVDITRIHYGCGGKPAIKPALKKVIPCDKCGKEYDQDVSAAQHLFERSGHGPVPAPVNEPRPRKPRRVEIQISTGE